MLYLEATMDGAEDEEVSPLLLLHHENATISFEFSSEPKSVRQGQLT